jgi:tetratricopeptide (TPR) repeat protein
MPLFRRKSLFLTPLLLGLFSQIIGCAQSPLAGFNDERPGITDIPNLLGEEALAQLEKNNLPAAIVRIQAALKLRPDSPELHLLLGFAYHLTYLSGGNTSSQALIAYDVAARLDDRESLPFFLRGHLHYATRQYMAAASDYKKALARSGQIHPDVVDAVLVASYQSNDLDFVETVLQHAHSASITSENILRIGAILTAINKAERGSFVLNETEPLALLRRQYGYSDLHLNALAVRLREVEILTTSLTSFEAEQRAKSGEQPIVQARSAPETERSQIGSRTGESLVLRKWFECDPEPGFFKPAESNGSEARSSAGDETEKLPAIPGVCQGDSPPTAVLFDTTIMRLQEIGGSSYGVDFLGALNVFLTGTRTLAFSNSNGSGERNTTSTFSYSLGSAPSADYISYALNISNVFGSKNEVLSQPSILAIDRLPSSFFSGSVLTLGVSGTAGSASTISDRPIGVSLSITPTVIDSDRLHISVKIARSSLAGAQSSSSGNSFSQALATNRTSVTTNVTARFDETLVISGLTENTSQSDDTGMPYLKDVPIIQGIFGRQSQLRSASSIIVSITPRRVNAQRYAEPASKSANDLDPFTRIRLAELTKGLQKGGDLESDRKLLRSQTTTWIARQGDVRFRHLRDPIKVQQVLREMASKFDRSSREIN